MPNPIRALWLKWKSLSLPWRRRILAGTDHNLNHYYYFRPSLSSPFRRILVPPSSSPHLPQSYSSTSVPVQWHQWLRHTRATPPSLSELSADDLRKEELKQLVKAADARWASKRSVLDKPRRPNQSLGVGDGEGGTGVVGRRGESVGGGVGEGREGEAEKLEAVVKGEDVRDSWGEGEKGRSEGKEKEKVKEKNPWIKEKARGAGEGWQPESWVPGGSSGRGR